MTHDEATDEARKRWGLKGFARVSGHGRQRQHIVGVNVSILFEQTWGRGKTWEQAFKAANTYKLEQETR
jgi:hypothetical protein